MGVSGIVQEWLGAGATWQLLARAGTFPARVKGVEKCETLTNRPFESDLCSDGHSLWSYVVETTTRE